MNTATKGKNQENLSQSASNFAGARVGQGWCGGEWEEGMNFQSVSFNEEQTKLRDMSSNNI